MTHPHSPPFLYTLHCVFLRYCLSILRSCFLCLIEILYELLYFAWLMTLTYVFSSLSLLYYRFAVNTIQVLFFWLFWRLWDFKFLQLYPPFPPKLVLAQTVTVAMNFESILNSLYLVHKRLFKIFNIQLKGAPHF